MSLNKFAYELGEEAALNSVGLTKTAGVSKFAPGLPSPMKARLIEALTGGALGGAGGYATGDEGGLFSEDTRLSHALAGAGLGAGAALGGSAAYRSHLGDKLSQGLAGRLSSLEGKQHIPFPREADFGDMTEYMKAMEDHANAVQKAQRNYQHGKQILDRGLEADMLARQGGKAFGLFNA